MTVPNPGSDAAIEAGCRCPVMDNHHGRGEGRMADGTPVFVFHVDCPLHGGGDWRDPVVEVQRT